MFLLFYFRDLLKGLTCFKKKKNYKKKRKKKLPAKINMPMFCYVLFIYLFFIGNSCSYWKISCKVTTHIVIKPTRHDYRLTTLQKKKILVSETF